MAQTVIEQMDSRSISSSGGKLTGRRVFAVYDDAKPIIATSDIQLGANGIPAYGEAFPDEPNIFVESYTISHMPDSSYTWKVELQYATGSGEPTIITPSEPGYVQVSIEYGGTFKDFWRAGPFSNYSANNTDIGGTPIDAAGTPTSVFVAQHRLVIEETVAMNTVSARSVNIRNAVATRNSSSFFGAAQGTLLYEGASARRLNINTFTIAHRFLYDEYYHQGQQPKKNSNRETVIEMAIFPFAATVRWVQPYPSFFNFSSLSENF